MAINRLTLILIVIINFGFCYNLTNSESQFDKKHCQCSKPKLHDEKDFQFVASIFINGLDKFLNFYQLVRNCNW